MASNSFNSFEESLNTTEAYYRQLMQGDLTPEAEAEIRVLLLGLFSTLKAHASQMESNEPFVSKLEDVRENIIAWNALGPWFREVKPLVDGVFSLITLGKELLLSASPQPGVRADEIESLREEIRDVKETVKSFIHALEASSRTIQSVDIHSDPMKSASESPRGTGVSDNESSTLVSTHSQLPLSSDVADHDESAEDSFMELISLEARKYAVEKAITNLETEFYDGRLPKDNFDKSMAKQRRELAQILNRISALREELETSS